MDSYDVVVVGAGAIGLSAAYWCSKAGKKVLLLDQFDFDNDFFSSKGESRFFRVMYSNPHLSLLAQSAYPLWRELEDDSGLDGILNDTSLLFFGPPSGVNTPEGDLKDSQAVLEEQGLPFTRLTAADFPERYPALKGLSDDVVGLVQPQAGVIAADRALQALAQLCRKQGVTMIPRRTVSRIQDAPGQVTVTTAQGDYTGKKLILVPSAWTNPVLDSLNLQLELEIWTMTYAYFTVAQSQYNYPLWFYFGAPQFPGDDQTTYYGLPPLLTPGRLKVGTDFTFQKSPLPPTSPPQADPRMVELLNSFMRAHFQGLQSLAQDPVGCLYTMTPDLNFVLDALPGHPDILLFTGDTGQAFKFTPLLGKILAELALTGVTQFNIQPFSIQRPGILRPR
ncbi:FAD-dependent oxidoreductase [Myxococcus sp. CA039A]|uniref:FAD-dependent oxidoreductase n=1 Tax=Myxococcus sp. CA039A TaxID=2741737 RepID=UPI00157B5AF4|nr:FAD-dependent oxidoreductase [Myxococcus sp. CA039A]NTX57012.1 FAD-dependent oxidoreductase [Myxococcus sp. CA039A]